jgi:hypothetical protein
MKEMAERNLDGKVDLDYVSLGVTWRLTCPAGNALSGFSGRDWEPSSDDREVKPRTASIRLDPNELRGEQRWSGVDLYTKQCGTR